MKARPILFSAPMIRALLDGTKSQTRRIIKPQPEVDQGWEEEPQWALDWKDFESGFTPEELARLCPYGKPGDVLWVRETWGILHQDGRMAGLPAFEFVKYSQDDYAPRFGGAGSIVYKSDGTDYEKVKGYRTAFRRNVQCAGRWRPSIHMPRWASRLTLELTEVRVERLQDISEADAEAEGMEPFGIGWRAWDGQPPVLHARHAYQDCWKAIHGPGSWDANPWLWVLSFRVHQKNVDALLAELGQP